MTNCPNCGASVVMRERGPVICREPHGEEHWDTRLECPACGKYTDEAELAEAA